MGNKNKVTQAQFIYFVAISGIVVNYVIFNSIVLNSVLNLTVNDMSVLAAKWMNWAIGTFFEAFTAAFSAGSFHQKVQNFMEIMIIQ